MLIIEEPGRKNPVKYMVFDVAETFSAADKYDGFFLRLKT
jgi:hypothetical protein